MNAKKLHCMKPSGVPWLGDIPEGWDIARVKSLASIVSSRSASNDNYIGLENVESGTGRFLPTPEEAFPAESSTIAIQKGDVLFGKLRPYLAKCLLSEWDGCCSSEFLVLRTSKTNPRFLKYALLSPTFVDYVNMSTYGTKMPRANWEIVGSAVSAIPPLPEQRAIADFLDEKCAAIDTIVEEAKSGIEEYAKWKQSVVFQAVTKGIPEGERHPTSDHRLPGDSRLSTSDGPDVESRMSDVEKGSQKSDVGRRKSRPMKDSGVEWIGEIPEEWKVCKTLFALQMPITDGPHTTPELFAEGVPFVSAEAVSAGNGTIDFSHIRGYISEEFYQECCLKYIPRMDDIYMIKSGATTGRVAIVDTERKFTIWSPLAVFRANPQRALPRFLFYFLQSDLYQKQVSLAWNFGTQQNIGMRALERLMLLLPPLPEQRSIAAYLDEKCSAIDALIEEKKQLIEDLGVYKKSLIYETVTGKRRIEQ